MKACIPFLFLLLLLAGCSEPAKQVEAAKTPDRIYFGGDILTMEGDSAQYAEAVVVREGRILFVGSKEQAIRSSSENPQQINLK